MDTVLPALISSDVLSRTHAMEQCELERELGQLHSESWGWALACCGRDKELAEDILQSSYLTILSRPTAFNGDSTLKTWVFGVIRWTARSELRRRWFWNRRHSALTPDFMASERGADQAVEDSDQRARLIRGLSALPRRQREVLQLVFYHDMTIEEAAGVMNVSLGSARTHYERGKKALARNLGTEVG